MKNAAWIAGIAAGVSGCLLGFGSYWMYSRRSSASSLATLTETADRAEAGLRDLQREWGDWHGKLLRQTARLAKEEERRREALEEEEEVMPEVDPEEEAAKQREIEFLQRG
jgi:hypothetical protein